MGVSSTLGNELGTRGALSCLKLPSISDVAPETPIYFQKNAGQPETRPCRLSRNSASVAIRKPIRSRFAGRVTLEGNRLASSQEPPMTEPVTATVAGNPHTSRLHRAHCHRGAGGAGAQLEEPLAGRAAAAARGHCGRLRLGQKLACAGRSIRRGQPPLPGGAFHLHAPAHFPGRTRYRGRGAARACRLALRQRPAFPASIPPSAPPRSF